MELVRDIAKEKNLLPEPPTPTNSQTSLSELDVPKFRPEPEEQNQNLYLAALIRIITKAISLANAPALTENELAMRARDWSEVLFDVVPQERLLDAFKRAAQDHGTSFPISMHDVRIAYGKIDAEEKAKAQAEREKFLADLESRNMLVNKFICDYCFNSGWEVQTFYDVARNPYKAAVKCYSCKYWQYWSEKHVKKA